MKYPMKTQADVRNAPKIIFIRNRQKTGFSVRRVLHGCMSFVPCITLYAIAVVEKQKE